jgi:predicted MPP superfamily phosphohydrolase
MFRVFNGRHLRLYVLFIMLLCSCCLMFYNVSLSSRWCAEDDFRVIRFSVSPVHPVLGESSVISILLVFDIRESSTRNIDIVDVFSGFIICDNKVMGTSGNVTLECFNTSTNYHSLISKRIVWDPVIPGEHKLVCLIDSVPVKSISVNVSFYSEQIVYPSLGCPSIISKDKNESLMILLSEEHDDINEYTNVEYVVLTSVNNPVEYTIYDAEVSSLKRIKVDNSRLEDELVLRCNVSGIPSDFYDLLVKTSKNTYTWPHAVKIIDHEPDDFTFVQLTDLHIGKQCTNLDEKEIAINKIRHINEYIKPDFIVLSGDMIDWSNKRTGYRSFLDLQEVIKTSESPVFTTPGNHERYNNRLMLLYVPYTNLTPYHVFVNPVSDYSLLYGGYNFVFLNSGYDYSRFEIKRQIWNQTPESTGLSNTQMSLLESVFTDYNTTGMIITMHHPAVNRFHDSGLNALFNTLKSGNDECIAFNRGSFIDYCKKMNVSMILSGHTHRNLVLNADGGIVDNQSVSSPLFIQTDSATLKKNSGGRVITIKDKRIESYSYQPIP